MGGNRGLAEVRKFDARAGRQKSAPKHARCHGNAADGCTASLSTLVSSRYDAANMDRVIILGRGGAGKSTTASQLGNLTGLPVVELDKHFWQPGLTPLSQADWVRVQAELSAADQWIMDGDFGPYDVLPIRLQRADTVILLDFPFYLCAWRALRRSRENLDFWWWVLTWRWASRPKLLEAIAVDAAHADLQIMQTPRALNRLLKGFAVS